MKLDLYKQAVRLIKIAEEQAADSIPSFQETFYSVPWTQGVVPIPGGKTNNTGNMTTDTWAKNMAKLYQDEYSGGNESIRNNYVDREWKDIEVPYKSQNLKYPKRRVRNAFNTIGLDWSDKRVQNLGNQPDVYDISDGSHTNYNPDTDTIGHNIYKPWATPLDRLKVLAHETAHRRAVTGRTITTPSYTNRLNNTQFDDEGRLIPSWEGIYASEEWPSIVTEWTYGTPGTIAPVRVRTPEGVSVPLRKLTDNDETTNAYYADMFPLVNMEDVHSEPGRVYSYWRGPNESDIPSNGKKRIVYETPSGWWVNQFGRYERTGGQLFDPNFTKLDDNTNLLNIPSMMQKHVKNTRFLEQGQPTDERQAASEAALHELEDLFAPLTLRTPFLNSNGKTCAQLIANTIDAGDRSSGAKGGDAYFMPIKGYPAENTAEAIERYPMWNPNMVLEPIPIGLAGLQKKYSLTPALNWGSDWRDVKQYKAIIRDAQHAYDLQNELDTYGPKDGGMGS